MVRQPAREHGDILEERRPPDRPAGVNRNDIVGPVARDRVSGFAVRAQSGHSGFPRGFLASAIMPMVAESE